MRYLYDTTVLEADTPEQLVRQMHELSLAQAKDDWAWMEKTSDRVFHSTGHAIRFGTAADFINDMMEANLIRRADEPKESK